VLAWVGCINRPKADWDIVKIMVQEEFSLRRLELSLALDAAFWVAYIITALIGGILSDRIGRKKIIVVSFLSFGTASFITGFAGNLTQLTIFRFMTGASIGAFFPAATAFIADAFPKRKRSRAIGIYLTGWYVGAVLGWVIAGYIVTTYNSWKLKPSSFSRFLS